MELNRSVQLSLRGVSCSFDGVVAVSDVSCDVEVGTVVALIGPNGAGKTTVFNLCCRFVKTNAGIVEIRGRQTTGMRPDQVAQLGLGRTFQDCKVLDQLSVMDNVMLGYRVPKEETVLAALVRRRHLCRSEKEKQDEAIALLGEVGLGDKTDVLAGQLSYGQRKLLEICRVRAFSPSVFLLDEPFAGLFPETAHAMQSVLAGLARSGRAVVFIEHDIDTVSRLANRVLVMNCGRLIADGTPSAILKNPMVLDAYLGGLR